MAHVIEKDWITAAGLRAAVLYMKDSHRCGYVEVPEGHPLFGISYMQLDDIETHGGLTYSENGDGYPVPSDGYWFGFDCNHSFDHERYGGYTKPLEFVVQHCEELAAQLVNYTPAKVEVEYDELASLRTDLAEAVGLLREALDRMTMTMHHDLTMIFGMTEEEATDEVDQDGPISRVRTFLTRHPATSERSEG